MITKSEYLHSYRPWPGLLYVLQMRYLWRVIAVCYTDGKLSSVWMQSGTARARMSIDNWYKAPLTLHISSVPHYANREIKLDE